MKASDFEKVLEKLYAELKDIKAGAVVKLSVDDYAGLDLDIGQSEVLRRLSYIKDDVIGVYDHDCEACGENMQSDLTYGLKTISEYRRNKLTNAVRVGIAIYMKKDNSESVSVMLVLENDHPKLISAKNSFAQHISKLLSGQKAESLHDILLPQIINDFHLQPEGMKISTLFKEELPNLA